jgi:hypothetical protein
MRAIRRPRATASAALLAFLVLSAPAAAARVGTAAIGIGEQQATVFTDPYFRALNIRHVRFVVGWDALSSSWQRAETDAWMAQARADRVRVLLAFNVSRTRARHDILPSVRQYRRVFRRFHRRYPFVRDFVSWNEANHGAQPTFRRPDRVAAYFDVIRHECPRCGAVAADVLDARNMPAYVQAVRRHARHRARLWGIHNYIDANRFRTTGTRALLRAVPGRIWFTETGGLVWRRHGPHTVPLGESTTHAARAVRWVFKLAALSPRITRVYFYHWSFPAKRSTWDSAFMDRRGRPRPAFRVLRHRILVAGRRR